jgi:hypothetical protein
VRGSGRRRGRTGEESGNAAIRAPGACGRCAAVCDRRSDHGASGASLLPALCVAVRPACAGAPISAWLRLVVGRFSLPGAFLDAIFCRDRRCESGEGTLERALRINHWCL